METKYPPKVHCIPNHTIPNMLRMVTAKKLPTTPNDVRTSTGYPICHPLDAYPFKTSITEDNMFAENTTRMACHHVVPRVIIEDATAQVLVFIDSENQKAKKEPVPQV